MPRSNLLYFVIRTIGDVADRLRQCFHRRRRRFLNKYFALLTIRESV